MSAPHLRGLKNTIYTADQIADYFLSLANETGESITNLKLQKLVYYAQAWYLANKSKPLIDAKFQAWVHGPVVPELYQKYKSFGALPIRKNLSFAEIKKNIDPDTLKFLDEIARFYMPKGAFELEQMTHSEDPWLVARNGIELDENSDNPISEDLMIKYYGERIRNSTYASTKK